MRNSVDKKSEPDNYHFIKETIKPQKKDRVRGFGKIVGIVVGGILFGAGAAFGFAVFSPAAIEKVSEAYGERKEVNLTETKDISENKETPQKSEKEAVEKKTEKNQTELADKKDNEKPEEKEMKLSLLESYEETYDEVLKVSEEPRKALVRVCGIGNDADLLDNTFVSYGDEQGILFFQNEKDYYILTGSKGLGETEQLRVTFCNGASATGELCGADSEMNFSVIRIPKIRVTENTMQAISVASLGDAHDSFQAKPVIAIGSPSGDPDAVVYGMVTSVSGKVNVSDWEFDLLATDMKGSSDGSGVLLDTSGKVVGLIVHVDGETTNIVRAVSMAQLRPLIEILCNRDSIRYLGIDGSTFSEIQKANMDVPDGIYVNGVESNSPAMIAGVRNGDIVSKINDKEIQNMQEYTEAVQSIKVGQEVTLKLYRSGAGGNYVEMQIKMTMKER